jgi:hypothetical protein
VGVARVGVAGALLAITVAAACAGLGQPPPGGLDYRGHVVIGGGVVEGTEWAMSARPERAPGWEQVCIDATVGEEDLTAFHCASVDSLRSGDGGGLHSRSNGLTVFAGSIAQDETGFVRPPIAGVQLETTAGMTTTAAAPLDALGLPALAFGLVLPAGVDILAIVWIDEDGNVIERHPTR